jgi:hypothetical protein
MEIGFGFKIQDGIFDENFRFLELEAGFVIKNL